MNEATLRNMSIEEKERAGLIPAALIPDIVTIEEAEAEALEDLEREEDEHGETQDELRDFKYDANRYIQDALDLLTELADMAENDAELSEAIGLETTLTIENWLTRVVNDENLDVS